MKTTHCVLSCLQPMLCPLPQTALTSMSINPKCALPGDALNSTVVDTSFSENSVALSTKEPISSSVSCPPSPTQLQFTSFSHVHDRPNKVVRPRRDS